MVRERMWAMESAAMTLVKADLRGPVWAREAQPVLGGA